MKALFVTLALSVIVTPSCYSMPPAALQLQLFNAAKNGNVNQAQEALRNGANSNDQDHHRRTSLHWAAMQGHSKIAHYLLDAGADQNARDANYHTPFHWAAMEGHTAVVKVFIDAHVNVNTQDRYKWTSLDWAIRNGHSDITKLLLNAGAHINTHHSHDYNPLTLAISDGHTQVVEFIENYINLLKYIKYTPSKQLLSQAIQFCYVHLVKLLLQAGIKPDIHDLTLVKLKYNQEPEQWHKDNYKAIGRMILQHLRLSGTLQTPRLHNMTNLLSTENPYGPIAKSGLGLPEDIVHTIASFTY